MPEESASEERYQVIGDRQGQVIVKDARSGEIIQTFQMEEGVVVRETFILDDGKTIAASQRYETTFWDLETGQEITHLNQRVYGFSEDETRFLSGGSQGTIISSYPEFSTICTVLSHPEKVGNTGVWSVQFSLDTRFAAIAFRMRFPEPEDMPEGTVFLVSGPGTVPFGRFFDLQTCQFLQGDRSFMNFMSARSGEFSPDSRFYEIGPFQLPREGKDALFILRIDLENRKSELVFERFL